jgi:G3E family GTPase
MAKPRLLLFGTPGAGKTSLLGALAQAAATQGALLKGQLADPAGDWERLQKNTYAGTASPTEESESYDLRLQPSDNGAIPIEAVVTDPSGKSAQEILKSKQPVLDMDTMLLAVDASLNGKQLAEEFQQFARWLIALRKARGKRTEIGELPVYLVLTKCDLLAKKEDTFAKWMQRIEEGKRRIDERFREFLKEQGTGFGTIQLQLWATAIKRPALADRPAKAQEPFGVAELFRQCLQAAADFQERRRASQHRLHNLVVGAFGMVAVLALVVALLFEFQPGVHHSGLDEQVQTLLPKKDAPAKERLQGSLKKLEEKQKALQAIENDPAFTRLPEPTQEAVAKYDAELAQYLLAKQLAAVMLKLPHLAKDQAEFKEMQKSVASFALPADHAKDWEETPLARQIQKVRKEYDALSNALKDEETWIRGQIDSDTALLKKGTKIYSKLLNKENLEPEEPEAWQKQYRDHMNPKFATPREEIVKGVSRLTYEDLGKFEQMQKAQKDWDASKRKLRKMADSIQDEMR